MGNLLSAIGRSQAIPQFLEQARLARKDEAAIASDTKRLGMEEERLGLARNADVREGIKLAGDNELNVERVRAAKVQAQEAERVKAEGDKVIPSSSFTESLPTKGMSEAMMNHFKRSGQLIDNGADEPGVTNRNITAFYDQINTKSPNFNPVLAHEVAGGHLTSTRNYREAIGQAMQSKDAFKAFKEQHPEINEKDLPAIYEDAKQEYDAAYNTFHQITEKDKIMRQEAADKQTELKRHNKELESIAKTNAGANVTKAGAAATKAGKPPALSVTEYKAIKEDMDGYGDKPPAEKAILNELAIQNGMVITKNETLKKRFWGDSTEVTYEPKPMSSFKTPESVKDAYNKGIITEDSAAKILEANFPDKFGG